jgi:hypothetical protein
MGEIRTLTQDEIKRVYERMRELESRLTKPELVAQYRAACPNSWSKHHPSTWSKDQLLKDVAELQLGLHWTQLGASVVSRETTEI